MASQEQNEIKTDQNDQEITQTSEQEVPKKPLSIENTEPEKKEEIENPPQKDEGNKNGDLENTTNGLNHPENPQEQTEDLEGASAADLDKIATSDLKNSYELIKSQYDLLNLKLLSTMKSMTSANTALSKVSNNTLSEYLKSIEMAKNRMKNIIKASEEIDDNFQAIQVLGLKTDFLRTQLQSLCLKNGISL